MTREQYEGPSSDDAQDRKEGHSWASVTLSLGGGPGPLLTGTCFFIADTFTKAAPESLTLVSAAIVVTYGVQRNVAHCRAQTHTDQLVARTQLPLVILKIMGLGQDT